jgi:hypothetical protein
MVEDWVPPFIDLQDRLLGNRRANVMLLYCEFSQRRQAIEFSKDRGVML